MRSRHNLECKEILYHSNEYDVVMVYTNYRVSYFYADNVSHLQSRRDALFTSTLSWFRVSYLHADNMSHPLHAYALGKRHHQSNVLFITDKVSYYVVHI